jgi:hypothetical protein
MTRLNRVMGGKPRARRRAHCFSAPRHPPAKPFHSNQGSLQRDLHAAGKLEGKDKITNNNQLPVSLQSDRNPEE